MQYTFGADNCRETLLTKGDEFTALSGFCQTVQEFADSIRTDSFRLVREIKRDTDGEGNHYVWYEIDRHNTIIDKTPKLAADVDYIAMMTGVELDEGGTDHAAQS